MLFSEFWDLTRQGFKALYSQLDEAMQYADQQYVKSLEAERQPAQEAPVEKKASKKEKE